MWDCALQIADNCTERGFDPPPTTIDDDPICAHCATEAKRLAKDHETEPPYRITD